MQRQVLDLLDAESRVRGQRLAHRADEMKKPHRVEQDTRTLGLLNHRRHELLLTLDPAEVGTRVELPRADILECAGTVELALAGGQLETAPAEPSGRQPTHRITDGRRRADGDTAQRVDH